MEVSGFKQRPSTLDHSLRDRSHSPAHRARGMHISHTAWTGNCGHSIGGG